MGTRSVKTAHVKTKRKHGGEEIPRLFEGEAAFVYATGPSLTEEVLERAHSVDGWRHIAISDYYRTGYPCDFYYACDHRWWNIHYEAVKEWNGCENGLWCTEPRTKAAYRDLHLIAGCGKEGWSTQQDLIHYGGNSGYQILNIAFLLGIKYMVLLGFNMSRAPIPGKTKGAAAHFFGEHPQGLGRTGGYKNFEHRFHTIKPEKHGVTVINATRNTALKAFPRMRLRDAVSGFRNT